MENLQDNFDIEDLYEEELATPDETDIYLSESIKELKVFVSLCFAVTGLIMVLTDNPYFIAGLIALIGGTFAFYNSYKKLNDRNPQIIISNEGIETSSTEFYNWADIKDETIESSGTGKNTLYYLTYKHPKGKECKLIQHFDITVEQIYRLLKIYRHRSEQNQQVSAES
ncbi:hypothetical protein CHISP_1092 [Chitinispirillum alkaliphilum]|nr:hypothetical protein CHISP_1092 [Chitinispirillum alkaliphilum]